MAFNAATQWEFQTTGDNTNGGGFYNATPGTSVDLALANTPVTFTDLVIDAATNTKITSATRPFTAADTGNIINITSGTGFTVQRVQITAVDGSNVATCDKAVGTVASTGGNGKMGGALAVPTDGLLELSVAGNTWWIKSGTYTLTESLSIAKAGSLTGIISFLGYKVNRWDNPLGTDRPLILCGSYSVSISGESWKVQAISLRGTSTNCLLVARGWVVNCKAVNTSTTANRSAFYNNSTDSSQVTMLISSEGISLAGYGEYNFQIVMNCYCHNSKIGFYSAIVAIRIIASISAYNTTYAAYFGNVAWCIFESTFIGFSTPVGTGIFSNVSTYGSIFRNNIVCGFAIGMDQGVDYPLATILDYNNFYNNTLDVSNFTKGSNDIALDPQFVSVGNIGSNLCTNGADWTGATGSTPPNSWDVKTAGTFTITASGQAGDYLKIAHNGTNNNPEISYAITTEIGKSYRITYYAQKGTATNATAKVGTTSGGTEIGYTATHTDTDWNTQKSVSFEAVGTTTYFSIGATTSTSGQYAMIDTVTIYEQGEDFTPGDNMKLDIDWTNMGL